MRILILNGSPRPQGETKKMISAFVEAASGHQVEVIDVCRKNIKGCMACEYCHTRGNGTCIQKDDMAEIIAKFCESDMLIIASPIYYHGLSGQIKCTIDRLYPVAFPTRPEKLNKIAMFLASGEPDMYEGAKVSYFGDFVEFLQMEGMGVFTNHEENVIGKIQAMAASL